MASTSQPLSAYPLSAYPLSPLASAAVRLVHGAERDVLLAAVGNMLMAMDAQASTLQAEGFSRPKLLEAVHAVKEAFFHRMSMLAAVLGTDGDSASKSSKLYPRTGNEESKHQQDELDELLRVFYEAVLALNDRMSNFQNSAMTLNVLKLRKLDKRLALLKAAWHEILLFLSLSVADQSKSQAFATHDQLAKLAIATGYPEWEEFKSNDGAGLLLQGDKYLLGIGAQVDNRGSESRSVLLTEQAMRRYELAANQCNYAPAQYMLGWVYEHGAGRPQDLSLAVQYYQQAATNQGSASSSDGPSGEAMTALGKLCMTGLGIPRNTSKGIEWYLKAAEHGCASAMTALAQLLEKGIFAHSIINDRFEQQQNAQSMHTGNEQRHKPMRDDNGDSMERESFTKVILKKDERKAIDYYKQAIKHQHTPAIHGLACLHYRNKDYINSVPLFRQAAADHHYPPAMNRLGMCYEQGHGVVRDHVLAKHWYEQASRRNHASGTSNLAYLYLTEKKHALAYELFSIAAFKYGHPDALFHLGQMHERGVSLVHAACSSSGTETTVSDILIETFEAQSSVNQQHSLRDHTEDIYTNELVIRKTNDSNALFYLPSNQVLALRCFLQAANHPIHPHQYALVKCGEYLLFGIASTAVNVTSPTSPLGENTISAINMFSALDTRTQRALINQQHTRRKGYFLSPDIHKSIQYFERVVRLFDNAHAILRLGQLAELGLLAASSGTQPNVPDIVSAKRWYQRAMAKDHAAAFYHLGAMFESGLLQVTNDGGDYLTGTSLQQPYSSARELSMRKAAELYVEAARRGCEEAKLRLQALERIATM